MLTWNMSYKILNSDKLNSTDKLVFHLLLYLADGTGYVDIQKQAIGTFFGFTNQTVQNAIKKLKDNKFIFVERKIPWENRYIPNYKKIM